MNPLMVVNETLRQLFAADSSVCHSITCHSFRHVAKVLGNTLRLSYMRRFNENLS